MLNQVLTSGVDFDPAGSAAAAQAASQPLDADLTAIAALTTTSFGRGGLTQVDAAAFRTYIGAGTGSSSGADPTASVGLTAVNGSAATFMRSDGAPPLDVTIAPTWSGAHTWSRNGAVSAPTAKFTGTWFTGGSATTTKPYFLIEVSGATSAGWNTAGTGLGINAATGFTGSLLDLQTNGASNFRVTASGSTTTIEVVTSGAGQTLILKVRDRSYSFSDGTGAGFTNPTSLMQIGELRMGVAQTIGWSSAAGPSGAAADTTLTRAAAGVVGLPSATATQTAIGTTGIVVKGIASRTVALLNLQTSAGASLGNVGGTVFNDFTDTSTTHTDGTEDDLYSYTTVANTLIINGDSVSQKEEIHIIANSTATRRIKKYFAGTLIWDSGDVTGQLNIGGATNTELWLETTVIRESATVVRVTVRAITTFTVATVPFVTYTRITGLTLTGTNILKTTGIASGSGAVSGDITNRMAKVITEPAA